MAGEDSTENSGGGGALEALEASSVKVLPNEIASNATRFCALQLCRRF